MAALSNTFLYFITNNPTLDQNQFASEYDTGLIKIGDGINPYKTLPYNLATFTGTRETGITAHAGGGQANAYQLHYSYNAIDTVATPLDSIKALPAIIKTWHFVHNYDLTNDLNFYPSLGDELLGLGVNNPLTISPGNGVLFFCYENGIYRF